MYNLKFLIFLPALDIFLFATKTNVQLSLQWTVSSPAEETEHVSTGEEQWKEQIRCWLSCRTERKQIFKESKLSFLKLKSNFRTFKETYIMFWVSERCVRGTFGSCEEGKLKYKILPSSAFQHIINIFRTNLSFSFEMCSSYNYREESPPSFKDIKQSGKRKNQAGNKHSSLTRVPPQQDDLQSSGASHHFRKAIKKSWHSPQRFTEVFGKAHCSHTHTHTHTHTLSLSPTHSDPDLNPERT